MKKSIFSFIIITILLLSVPSNKALGQEYRLNYTADQVSMELELTMKLHEIKEFNVSITNVNSSITAIIEILDDSGPLWGFYLVKANDYYPMNHSLLKLQDCCIKYADHAVYYSVIQILFLEQDQNYVLAFYDTHGHPAEDTHFRATFLKGIVGEETTIVKGPTKFESIMLYVLLPMATITFFGILGIQILKIRRIKREKGNIENLNEKNT